MTHHSNSSCSLPPNEVNLPIGLKKEEKAISKDKKEGPTVSSTSANFQTNVSTYSLSDLQHVYNNSYNSPNNMSGSSIPPPHFYSPILGTQQALLRPLMSTQPPLYSPILNAQQHTYPLPHPSPSSCFPAIPDSLRNGTLDNVVCSNTNASTKKPNEESSKSCNIPESPYKDGNSKRLQNYNSHSSQSNSCNNLHEQRIFEEYIRLYNEEGNCRLWADSIASPSFPSTTITSTTNTATSQPTNLVKGYASQTSSNNKVVNHGFPDCRLESSWNRGDSNWAQQAVDDHIAASNSSRNTSAKGNINGVENTRTHVEYPSAGSSILPYLGSFSQVQDGRLPDRDGRQVQECNMSNKDQIGTDSRKTLYECKKIEDSGHSSAEANSKGVQPPQGCASNSIMCRSTPTQGHSYSNTLMPNSTQGISATQYPSSNQTLLSNNMLTSVHGNSEDTPTNTQAISASSTAPLSNASCTGSTSATSLSTQHHTHLNHHSVHMLESIDNSTQMPHLALHSQSFTTSSTSNLSYSQSNNTFSTNPNTQDLSNHINSLHLTNQPHDLVHSNISNQLSISSSNINNPNKSQYALHTHDIQNNSHSHEPLPCPSVHHSERVQFLVSHAPVAVNDCLATNNNQHQAPNTQSQHTHHKHQDVNHMTNSYQEQSSALQSVTNPQIRKNIHLTGTSASETSSCMNQKFPKSHNVKYGGDLVKKRDSQATDNLQNHNEICLICGITVDISCHCSIDTPLTVPSKITVGEKLNLMVGCQLPREALPSLAVCPKCFYVINEVESLEHRLTTCRKEVLQSLESALERNNIHLYPYKRLQCQQFTAYQNAQDGHNVQFVYPGNGSQLVNQSNMMAYQNDHQQQFQGYFNQNVVEQHSHHQHFHNFQGDTHSASNLPMHNLGHSSHNHIPQQSQEQMQILQQTIAPQHPDQHKSQQSLSQTFTQKNVSIQTNQESLNLSRQTSSHDIQDLRMDVSHQRHGQNHPQQHIHNLTLSHQHIQTLHHKNEKQSLQESQSLAQNHPNSCSLHQNSSQSSLHQNSSQSSLHQNSSQSSLHQNSTQSSLHQNSSQSSLHQNSSQSSLHHSSQSSLHQNSSQMACIQQGPLQLTLEKNIPHQLDPVPSVHPSKSDPKIVHPHHMAKDNSTKVIEEPKHNKVKSSDDVSSDNFVEQNLLLPQSNHVSLLLQETPEQLMENPLSVLLPGYQSPSHDDSREYENSRLLVDVFEENELEIPSKSHIDQEAPLTSYDLDDRPSNHATWNDQCNTASSIMESIPLDPSNRNPQECNIDIESCDIVEKPESLIEEADLVPESKSSRTEMSSHSNLVSKSEVSSLANDLPDKECNATFVGSPNTNHTSPCSPDPNDLDILLSPRSHPPPPLAPDGLRNVQDATEYHKPTLLGKNIKVKKHAKLQICRQCDQVFSNRQALIRHIERRHKTSTMTYRCDTCHRKFNSERTFKHHLQSHKTYPCKVCNKIFLKLTKLKKHMEEHPQESLVCKICNKETKTQQALKNHIKVHDRKSFMCTTCSSSFTCKRNLEHHMRIHTGEKNFSCTICKREFRHESNMVAHHKICSGKPKFVCHICNRGYSLESLFKKHLLEHKGQYAHRCSICNKGFRKPYGLRHHFYLHKNPSLSYPCSICGPDLHTNCNDKDKPLKPVASAICQVCGKVVPSNISLKDHLAKHNGIRNYKCKLCTMAFYYQSNLQSHVQNIHLGRKPHRCSICDRQFANSYNLKLHMRSHTGERPYQCKDCGKAFSSKTNYKRHLKCHFTQCEVDDSENQTNSNL